MSTTDRISERIGVIGLGYVGLPLAVAFSRRCDHVIGFDLSERRIRDIRDGVDATGEVDEAALEASTLIPTAEPALLEGLSFYVLAVPTPVDDARNPDLNALMGACETVGARLGKGAVVVLESTVYPGATEDICRPILERASGLVAGRDFSLGYSPERINPGDEEHRLENIVKVVAGQDAATVERMVAAYGRIIEAGLHVAASIRVAEAAKVIENTQRDLNVALMNELALIFDRLGISTRDVLAAARTKWNFLGFTPGLVGGHCIGVDPYYLTAKAEAVGYHPEVILSGRRINDELGRFIGQRVVKLMVQAGLAVDNCSVGILGVTFKENVPDIRNSKVPDIIRELSLFGIKPLVHDPLCASPACQEENGFALCTFETLRDLQALILAVPHRYYLERQEQLLAMLRRPGLIVDIKSALDRSALPPDVSYWSL